MSDRSITTNRPRLSLRAAGPAARPPLLVTSYGTGAERGRNLGLPGYSYDVVTEFFRPLLESLGPTELMARADVQARARQQAAAGHPAVHVSFLPFQDVPLCDAAVNIAVPAWEFPEIPDQAFDGNAQNDWVATANRCDAVLVGGPFTGDALRRAGVTRPIHVVPVPTPDAYFQVAPWRDAPATFLDCHAYRLPEEAPPPGGIGAQAAAPGESRAERFRVWARLLYRHTIKPALPRRLEAVVRATGRAAIDAWQLQRSMYRRQLGVCLSGVVYTSLFNPDDGRKNWEDLLTGFLAALGDCEDATLVLKLVAGRPDSTNRLLTFYRKLGLAHRCRIVVIDDYLSDAALRELAQASTYYLTTTRAEGNCLPAMNYLAAGRPVIAPRHTALADYFDADVGFVVPSHPEPTYWPHDTRRRWRATWHRLVWSELVTQIRASYELVRQRRRSYEALAAAARERMRDWASPAAVGRRLGRAWEQILDARQGHQGAAGATRSAAA